MGPFRLTPTLRGLSDRAGKGDRSLADGWPSRPASTCARPNAAPLYRAGSLLRAVVAATGRTRIRLPIVTHDSVHYHQ